MLKALAINFKRAIFTFLLLSPFTKVSSQINNVEFSPKKSYQYLVNSAVLRLNELGSLRNPMFSEADIDNDGNLDLYVFDRSSQRQVILLSRGTNFTVATTNSNWPKAEDFVLLADYNCDNIPDFFTGSVGSLIVYTGMRSAGELTFASTPYTLNSFYSLSTQDFTAPIFVNSLDVPVIKDLDGDGDLDILSTSSTGIRVEKHLNISVDSTGNCGLDFILESGCYGDFLEANENGKIDLAIENCPLRVKPRPGFKHSGTNLYYDDKTASLLLGELGLDSLLQIQLVAKNSYGDSAIAFNSFPKDKPISIPSFPAAYQYKDQLIVAPGASPNPNTHNAIKLLSYQNNSWVKVEENFLLDKTINVGNNPRIAHYQKDGDYLLSLSTVTENGVSKQVLNRFSIRNKQLVWVDSNYCNPPQVFLKEGNFITVTEAGDLTMSGKNGEIYSFNPSESDSCDFNFSYAAIYDLPPFNEEFYALPIDLDGDGNEEIIVSGKSGWIKCFERKDRRYQEVDGLWKNLKIEDQEEINPRGLPSIQKTNFGHLLTLSYADGSTKTVALTKQSPYLTSLNSVNSKPTSYLGREFHLIPYKNEYFIATKTGGIIALEGSRSLTATADELTVYPNPSRGVIFFSNIDFSEVTAFNSLGEELQTWSKDSSFNSISLNQKSGVYYLKFTLEGGNAVTKRVVIIE